MKYLLIIFALSSCSANYHLRKAIAKDPSILTAQSVTIIDTVIIPSVRFDSVYTTLPNDTITIEKERLKIRVIRELDTLIISGECQTDTVIRIQEVKVSQIIYKEKENRVVSLIAWLALVVALIYFLRRFIDRVLS